MRKIVANQKKLLEGCGSMGDTIDSLNIEVQASAVKANDTIEKLIGKLSRLSTSLTQINGHSLISLSSGVNRLASAMQGMSSVRTVDFTNLAKNIGKIGAIDSASISSAAASVHQFSNALNSLGNTSVSGSAAQFGELAKGIAQLGYKSSTKAIENIPQLATAMKQLMATLSGAPRVSQNLIDMTNALARLARTGASSGKAANSLSASLNTFSASTKTARTSSLSLASAFGKLYASYWVLFRAFRLFGKAIDISSDLTEVQNVVDVTFGDMVYKVEEFAETSIEQFGMSELALKQYASRFQAMGSAMGIDSDLIGNANSYLSKVTNGYIGLSDSMSDVSLNLTKLTADMASFYNLEQDAVAEDLEAIFTGQTRPLRTYGLDLTQATLQEWALKQGLDADIQSMSQAEKTMLRYQYVMANTGASQGDFARTADTWANQVRILKQNFEQLAAVIGSVFINALKPLVKALNTAMSYIIAFAKTISNALGKIFGWKYEESGGGVTNDLETGADAADDIASGVGDAADNAKKLKQQLQGFDELNVLTSDSDSGSGNGSGSGSGGISGGSASGGQWTQTDSILKEFESDIDSLYELGEYIGKTLTDAMNSINWDSVYQSARNFGSGLASFLNGLISPELFGAVGKTIAGALNTAIYSALSFGKTFDWTNFGLSIATGINEFFKTFDFAALAQTINTWVQGIWTTVKTAISNIDWKNVWEKVKEFLSEIDIETVEILLGAFTLKYAGKLLTALSLKKILSEIIDKKVAAAFGSTAVKSTLSYVIPISLSILVGLLSATIGKDSIKEDIENLKKSFENDGVLGYLEECFNQLVNPFEWINTFGGGVLSADIIANELSGGYNIDKFMDELPKEEDYASLEDFQKALNDFNEKMPKQMNVPDSFDLTQWIEEWKYMNGLEDIDLSAEVVLPNAKEKIEEWRKNINEWWGTTKFEISEWFDSTGIPEWYEDNIKPWFTKEKWQELGNGIKDGLSTKWDEFKTWWAETGVPEWWNDVTTWFTVEKWQELGDNAKKALSTKWSEFTTWWKETGIYKWWNDNVKPYFTKEKWISVSKGIKEGLTTKWNEFSSWWKTTGIYSWWNQHVTPYFTKNKWSFSGIKDGLSSAWSSAIESIKGLWNTFATWLNSKLTINIDTSSLIGKGISEVLGTNVIKLGNIPAFAVGGFPEDGLFMANHGELVGRFSNGRTAVANNDQITQGIADAVYPAVYNAVSAAMKNNSGGQNVTFQVEGDPNGMFKVMQKKASEYMGTTGRPAFDF